MQTKNASEIIRNNKHGSKEKSDLLPKKKNFFANQYITKSRVLLRPSGLVKGEMKTMTDD